MLWWASQSSRKEWRGPRAGCHLLAEQVASIICFTITAEDTMFAFDAGWGSDLPMCGCAAACSFSFRKIFYNNRSTAECGDAWEAATLLAVLLLCAPVMVVLFVRGVLQVNRPLVPRVAVAVNAAL